ncbi:MAG TPA: hypothetical protein VNI02_04250, partial [Blastocatellia bacterium]|nr:hypothetical protein [Blastocatellia bacterium]
MTSPDSPKKSDLLLSARPANSPWIEAERYARNESQSESGYERHPLSAISARHAARLDERDQPRADGPRAAPGKRLRDDAGVTLLLDLSGDKDAALEWAARNLPRASIRSINKADLKWSSKREAFARVRSLAPDTFAIFTSDLCVQSARSSIILFAALSGARRVVFADRNGRSITRSRAGAFIIDGPRLALELLLGYGLIVPLSWALTELLGAALIFRKVLRAGRGNAARERAIKGEPLTALYVRATLVPSLPQSAGSAGGMASHVRGFTR